MNPPHAGTSLLSGPSLRRLFADLVFRCPACGADISYGRRYWGFATAGQVKAILVALILVILGFALFMSFAE
jgi:hypothetical protein